MNCTQSFDAALFTGRRETLLKVDKRLVFLDLNMGVHFNIIIDIHIFFFFLSLSSASHVMGLLLPECEL